MSASTMMRASSGPCDGGLPTEFVAGSRGVADQCVDLGRPKVPLVEPDVVLPVQPGVSKEISRKSRTVMPTPVASTKSSGSSTCSMRHMPSTYSAA